VSGSGKSTLARAIVGLLPIAGGSLLLDGVDCTSSRARNALSYRRRVQMVFQDPHSSLNPRMRIGEAIGEALARREDLNRSQRRAERRRVLELVGMSENSLDRYPHQFSGGQRQRIALARALALRPDIIVLDEVTSALDVSVQATILNLLRDLQAELGVTYLFISHDLSVIGIMSDVVAVMYLGQVVERAETESLFGAPQHPYTGALLRSIPRFSATRVSAPLRGDLPDPRKPPPGCRFHTRCPVGPIAHPERTVCTEIDPHAGASDRLHDAACHFSGVGAALADAPAEQTTAG
jgi:oligopeptide/dipeptide ABC transporter ATP-binding protein